MISTRGFWYDGKISERREVTITCGDDAVVRVSGDGVEVSVSLQDLRIDPRLETARRIIRFPDGAAAETGDHGAAVGERPQANGNRRGEDARPPAALVG